MSHEIELHRTTQIAKVKAGKVPKLLLEKSLLSLDAHRTPFQSEFLGKYILNFPPFNLYEKSSPKK